MNRNELCRAALQGISVRTGADDDYIDPADGLRYCGRCHTPKEAYFPDDLFDEVMTHPVPCRCEQEQYEREERERMARQRAMQIHALRMDAFRDIPAALWRFDTAPTMTAQLAKARQYAENWDSFRQDGIGLLLFGGVGTGKTYAAGCIANALIDRRISVLMVSMTDAVNRMQRNSGADRESYLKSLTRPELLILDDLGAERSTTYGKERVFDVINSRWLSRKPMIITTNIPLSAMKSAAELDDRRIYDRILEVCAPIAFSGESFRTGNAAQNLKTAAQYLSGRAEDRR